MRKFLILVMVGFMLASSVDARRPKKKAGSIDGGKYVDAQYNFTLTMPENWKFKIGDADDKARLVLTQNNYKIPPQYLNASDYTRIPRTVVYVDTTGMAAADFIDSLVSENYSSSQMKAIYAEFEILSSGGDGSGMSREKLVPRQRRPMEIGGERGLIWSGKVKYRNEISLSESSMGAERVYGGYEGSIVGVKKGDLIILFHTMCEEDYSDDVMTEMTTFVGTLEFSK
ncbi:MAG: hypothetical protein AB1483_11050 [Candidatus Zixiibacteriota bacterium]